MRLSIKREEMIASTVVCLRNAINPSAIIGAIITIIVYTVYGQLFRVSIRIRPIPE